MTIRSLLIPVIILTLLPSLFFARNDSPKLIKNIRPELEISRFSGEITIDGDLSEAAWKTAAVAENFVETNPGDQIAPEFSTRALVGYDDNNFYFAFLASANPNEVRASLRNRDEIWQDDNVGILLDTFGDGAWAYEIFVNPLGVQGDIRWINNRGEDDSFDLIYHSRGKITEAGFQVEIAVPFSSLRFPHRETQTWSATFWRNLPRESRHQYSWATIDRDDPCWTCQWGKLTGIRGIISSNNIEILPAMVATQSSALADGDDPESKFKHDNIDPDASIGVKYTVSPNLTLEAAINPDFSQVESDADEIDVNNTFAISYPEKRPFFQEGTDLFQTNLNIVYTRALNDPNIAAKVTGRWNRTSIALLSVQDENTPVFLPLEERTEFAGLGKSVSNIFRLKQTFGENSHAGLIFTDRRLEKDGHNSVIAFDGQLRFRRNYRLEWQMAGSATQEPDDTTLTRREDLDQLVFDDGNYSTAFDGEDFNGFGGRISFIRDARVWNWEAIYTELSPTFRADNGFIARNDSRQAHLWNGWIFRPNREYIKNIMPNFNLGRVWNHGGRQKDEWIHGEMDLDLKYQSNIELSYLWNNETFRNIYFSKIRRFQLELSSRFSEMFGFGYEFEAGRYIARNEDTPVLGKGFHMSLYNSIKPTSRLIIEPEFSYARLTHPDSSRTLFDGYILRTRLNYQFTRELYLRLVVQYNKFDHQVSIEPLLTYRINPFSLFYIGANDGYERFDGRTDYRQTSRQFFMKLQYLFSI